MEFKDMTIEELEARKAEIANAVDAEGADLDALEEEVRGIKAELETRKAEAEKKAEIRAAVASGKGKVVKEFKEEKKEVKTLEEIRASKEYIDAFAEYIKSEDDTECRSLLTETVSGTVPVPTIIDEMIRTAWENDEILSRVRKTYIRGNLKVAFERAADPAVVHTEGTDAPNEESLTLGIVTMIPANIKKWIRISDEAAAMGGEAFLRYVYDELNYQIAKKLSDLIVADIAALNTTASATAPAAAKISTAPSVTTIATAFANLSDEARNPVVIMNKLTYADFIAAQAAANFSFDPFNGLPVLFSSALKAYSAASSGEVYAIVGDLNGAQINFPEGDDIVIKYDDLSEAEADLIKIVGRRYAAHAVTASGRFCNIAKA